MTKCWLKKVDHIAYAIAPGMIEKWAWFHIEVEGGTLINRIDDAVPGSEDSSMKIWCIDFGSFGIALVEGIDRKKKSQVTEFVEVHGDHTVQHVAYDTFSLEGYQEHLAKYRAGWRGQIFQRNDGFGILKQVFGKGFTAQAPGSMSFSEYVERPENTAAVEAGNITFSQAAGKTFYQQIEDARERDDRSTFLDFGLMPKNWQVPEPSKSGRCKVGAR